MSLLKYATPDTGLYKKDQDTLDTYERQSGEYNAKVKTYNADLDAWKAKANAYNDAIKKWNATNRETAYNKWSGYVANPGQWTKSAPTMPYDEALAKKYAEDAAARAANRQRAQSAAHQAMTQHGYVGAGTIEPVNLSGMSGTSSTALGFAEGGIVGLPFMGSISPVRGGPHVMAQAEGENFKPMGSEGVGGLFENRMGGGSPLGNYQNYLQKTYANPKVAEFVDMVNRAEKVHFGESSQAPQMQGIGSMMGGPKFSGAVPAVDFTTYADGQYANGADYLRQNNLAPIPLAEGGVVDTGNADPLKDPHTLAAEEYSEVMFSDDPLAKRYFDLQDKVRDLNAVEFMDYMDETKPFRDELDLRNEMREMEYQMSRGPKEAGPDALRIMDREIREMEREPKGKAARDFLAERAQKIQDFQDRFGDEGPGEKISVHTRFSRNDERGIPYKGLGYGTLTELLKRDDPYADERQAQKDFYALYERGDNYQPSADVMRMKKARELMSDYLDDLR